MREGHGNLRRASRVGGLTRGAGTRAPDPAPGLRLAAQRRALPGAFPRGRYLAMFSKIECDCMQDWPPGMRFVLGFGRAVTEAVKTYVENNRHLLAEEREARTAIR